MSGHDAITVLQYVGYDDDRGGIMAVIRALAATARFHCVVGVNPEFRAARASAFETLALPTIAAEKINVVNLLRARRVAREARRWLCEDEPRVFHGHSRAGLLATLWLHAWGERRVVATVHCYGRQRWFYRWAARRLRTHLQWLSPAMKQYYEAGDPTWADCLPDCVPESAVRATRVARPSSRLTLGCAGALAPIKQWELVLQALARVPRELGVRLCHVGGKMERAGGDYAATLQRTTAELGLADRVEWRGAIDNMDAFFGTIDCLVVAARGEAFSVAALEAIANQVPVLASDASGTRDLITAVRGGWTFPADSPQRLADEIIRLASSDALRSWKRDEAGLARFLASSVAAQHADVYARLLAPSPSPAGPALKSDN